MNWIERDKKVMTISPPLMTFIRVQCEVRSMNLLYLLLKYYYRERAGKANCIFKEQRVNLKTHFEIERKTLRHYKLL